VAGCEIPHDKGALSKIFTAEARRTQRKELVRKSGGRKCAREAKTKWKYIAANAKDSEQENTACFHTYTPSICRAERASAIIHAGKDMPGSKRHQSGKQGID
jgi:hypothetical protein